ncbi:hypothetical protein [Promicromonospora umidemergens]|uniref:hypothetical protein n=1 Tax=Promicromonospora umidemergens TaxID=629679 RepID=UPI0020A4D3D9|nr:hypothetical protein [Promicromonospora umidemergens]
MLATAEIADRLSDGAAAVLSRAPGPLAEIEDWLLLASARELLRIDRTARFWRHRDALGSAGLWEGGALGTSGHLGASLASMHGDGRVREAAVGILSRTDAPLADRMLSVRLTDHVWPVREAATRAVLRRTSLTQADQIVPVLHLIEGRTRGAEVLPLYLHAIAGVHGEAALWSRLRGSTTPAVRRTAFRHSLTNELLSVSDAVATLPLEHDRIVQSLLAHAIADRAAPDVVASALLSDRSAESRVLGLVRLTADLLDPADVERLLVDPGVLVRLWARQRYQEQGRDTLSAYQDVARGSGPAAVRARAYRGLVEAGGTVDREVALDLVVSTEPPLKKAGLHLLAGSAFPADAPLLFEVLRTGTNRVARLASEVLLEMPAAWSDADLLPLASSPGPDLRRRAWWLKRNRSGWDQTIADLEILLDHDPVLAALGRNITIPEFAQPTELQRDQLMALLPRVWPETWRKSRVAFAAGLRSDA